MSVEDWQRAQRVAEGQRSCDLSYTEVDGSGGRQCGDVASVVLGHLQLCAQCADFLSSLTQIDRT